jgi:hypothetical protein
MVKRFTLSIIIIVASLFIVPYFSTTQAVMSNCVIVNVNIDGTPQNLDPRCATGINGLQLPPGMGPENPAHKGYFQLPYPDSPNGSYKSYACANHAWGSKELISVLYTVAEAWKKKYPQGWVNIGDMTAVGHKSHMWGRAADLDATTNGKDLAADFTKGNYNREATIELGKLFVDTDQVLHIWFNDQSVNSAVLEYSRQTGKSAGMVMHPIVKHDDHFHLDVKQNPEKLEFWTPSC